MHEIFLVPANSQQPAFAPSLYLPPSGALSGA
jgi:hypothetical protein